MGKLKDKLKKVEQNVRHAIEEVEPAISHAIQKIDVRATLSPYRKAAQDALESAEKELAEMNVVLATAQSIKTDTKARLERLPLAGSEDDQKFVSERVNIIRSGVQKLLNIAGYPIPVAQPAHQAQPLVGQEQFGIDNVELDPVHEVLKAEAAAVEAAAPPHCGAELPPQGAANEAEDLPPEYEPNLEVVVHIEQHIESKAQAEDPQAAMIRQLQEQMAAIQQQFAALLAQQQGAVIGAVASPSPVVTPLRALHAEASISSDNVPAPVSQRPGEASSCP